MSDQSLVHRTIPPEHGPHAFYPPLNLSVDEEGDVWFSNEEGSILLSVDQAYKLHFFLGQMLVEHTRAAMGRSAYHKYPVANIEASK
jgi:hypothetical protein